LKYILKRWQDSWDQQIYSKLHEIHSLAGKTSCSYGQIRQEPVVLTRCRIGHCRITHCYFIKQWGKAGMYSVLFQLFIVISKSTCFLFIDLWWYSAYCWHLNQSLFIWNYSIYIIYLNSNVKAFFNVNFLISKSNLK